MNYIETLKSIIKTYPNKSAVILFSVFLLSLFIGIALLRTSKKHERNIYRFSGFAAISFSLIFIIFFFTVFSFQRNKNNHIRSFKENIEIHTNLSYSFGIDISHYQGKIDWNLVHESQHPIEFIFIRATMGADGIDFNYQRNLMEAEKLGFLVGSYHFYRPNEDAIEQFENFKKNALVSPRHLPPVLDVEWNSSKGKEDLIAGIKVFLDLIEGEYGVKPIIYSGLDFWEQNLKNYFSDYPIWIAAYSRKSMSIESKWDFHQFSENVIIKGIDGYVDGNYFNGNIIQLRSKFIMEEDNE